MLRWDRIEKLVKATGEDIPPKSEVSIQGMALVLGENVDAFEPGVGAIRQGEIDDPVLPAKWHSRLCPVSCERIQPLALSACQNQC
jgi:hypothetical protein